MRAYVEIIAMQTLGLASEQKPTDGLLKRLFWPTIENQYDVDLVRQQGFWLCAAVAILSMAMLIANRQPWTGFLIGMTYLLAGIGVREGSVGAAVIIFLCYLCDRVVAIEGAMIGFGAGSPVIGLFALALLLSNIRATLLSRRWVRTAGATDGAEDVERGTNSLGDKIANVMPAAVWPKGQYVFYPLGGGLLLVSVLGMIMLPAMQRRRAAQMQEQRQQMEINLPAR